MNLIIAVISIVYFRITGFTRNDVVTQLLIRPYDIETQQVLPDTHIAFEPPYD